MVENRDLDKANAAISIMLDGAIERVPVHGSHTHFDAHAGMHGFLMNRDRFSKDNIEN